MDLRMYAKAKESYEYWQKDNSSNKGAKTKLMEKVSEIEFELIKEKIKAKENG